MRLLPGFTKKTPVLIGFRLTGIDIYRELETGACGCRPLGAFEAFDTTAHHLALVCSYCRKQLKHYSQFFQETRRLRVAGMMKSPLRLFVRISPKQSTKPL